MNTKKISSTIMYVILGISVITLALLFLMRGEDGLWGAVTGMDRFDGLDVILIWGYILLAASVLTAVVMTVVNMGKNPGGSKRGLYGLAVLAVILLVSYFLSSADPVAIRGGKEQYTDKAGLIVTDMGIYTAYFAMILAVGVVVYGAIKNSFKK